MNILGSLIEQLGSGGVEQIGRSVGLSSGDVTNVLSGAVPAMMAGLTRNSSSSDGGGDAMDDIVSMGSGLLGGLFKK